MTSEIYSPTEQYNTGLNTVLSNADIHSTLQEVAKVFARMDKAVYRFLATVCRSLDHEKFHLQTMARTHGVSTVSDWAELIELRVTTMISASTHGFEYPDTYLRNTSHAIYWAEAEVVFNQHTNETRFSEREPNERNYSKDLLYDLNAYGDKNSILITDLLPKLVELELFDLQMQAVLRRKWIIIDSIVDCYFQEKRTFQCPVPRWLVKVDFGCIRNGN